ncbi:MAG TPA: hypothetical protein VL860_07390 [Planctomycetota bacterium]|nr:hypothetical protein [Planctomycetota bacterium]
MPTASVVERPTIATGATPVYNWSIANHEVMYYWYKVQFHYVDIHAKGYFPAEWNGDADAVWEISIKTRDGVPGTYLGVLRNYIDASGAKRREIVPPVPVEVMTTLNEGMYAVIENGVETEPDNPKKIKSIRPVLHIYMVRDDHMINAYFDHPVNLVPEAPSPLTPSPAGSGDGQGPKGTPLNVLDSAPPAGGPATPKDHVDPVSGIPGNTP